MPWERDLSWAVIGSSYLTDKSRCFANNLVSLSHDFFFNLR